MDKNQYMPNGILQGDDKAMPDRGTGTGMNGDAYGADLGQDASNAMGSINSDTQSDPEGQPVSDDDGTTVGSAKMNDYEDRMEGKE